MISQILIGRGEMPAYAHRLSDEEISAVAEYIRNSWGNELGAVAPQDVANTSKTLKEAAQATAAPTKPQ